MVLKVPCIIEADLEVSPTGLKSRLAKEVGGKPLLWWTLKKAGMLPGVSELFVLAKKEHTSQVKELAGSNPCTVIQVSETGPISGKLFRRQRKWALNSWRGGIAGATVFSEEGRPGGMLEAAQRAGAEYVLKIPAAGPLACVRIASDMIDNFNGEMPVALSNAPPGLGIEIYSTNVLQALAEHNITVDGLLKLDINRPIRDPAVIGLVHLVPQKVAFTQARFLGDSGRGWDILLALFEKWGEEWIEKSADQIVEVFSSDPVLRRWRFPREIEIEVTTACVTSSPSLGLRGTRDRVDMDVDTFERALGTLDGCDDLCVTLGGYGEPLTHPKLDSLLAMAEKVGVFGIHVHVDSAALDKNSVELLVNSPVDVISIAIDAATDETWEKIKGRTGLEQVSALVEDMINSSGDGKTPIVIPEFTKQQLNIEELGSFYEKWYKAAGWVVIRTQDDLAGRIKEDLPLALTLGNRIPCMHLTDRLFVLADGRVPVCIQDFHCTHVLGNVMKKDIADIWTGSEIQLLLDGHWKSDYTGFAMCVGCKRWCTP